jgi:hypothetical protein
MSKSSRGKAAYSSTSRLIDGLPNRTHYELLEMYHKCAERMIGRNLAAVSPKIIALYKAIIAEWSRRYHGLLRGEAEFKWPSTDAPIGSGGFCIGNAPSEGMLATFGYHVGETNGVSEAKRRFLLDQIFSINLPPINSVFYMKEWAAPGTQARLKKLAETLAAFTRNKKRDSSKNFLKACEEWEADLRYLKEKYYRQNFDWPDN